MPASSTSPSLVPSAAAPPQVAPSAVSKKRRRGRFAEEYERHRAKQDEYYTILLEQTNKEHEEKMKVLKTQLEAAESEKKNV